MARFTLSIADDIAAQLDAYAAENNLNRSQAAEHIFRSAFDPGSEGKSEEEEVEPAGDLAYLADQLLELQDYMTLLIANHQTLRNLVITTTDMDSVSHHPRLLPEAPWVRRARGY
jgi:metal-responsive CopG/Arc/MetJ family transcriptional regulator